MKRIIFYPQYYEEALALNTDIKSKIQASSKEGSEEYQIVRIPGTLDIIEYKLEEWIENGKNYPEMMRKFKRYIDKKDNNKVLNKVKDEIKLLLYNNRNLISKEKDGTIEIN